MLYLVIDISRRTNIDMSRATGCLVQKALIKIDKSTISRGKLQNLQKFKKDNLNLFLSSIHIDTKFVREIFDEIIGHLVVLLFVILFF